MKNRVVFQGVVGLVLGMMIMQYMLGIQMDVRPLLLVSLASGCVLYFGQRFKVFLASAILGMLLVPFHVFLIQSTPGGLWESTDIRGTIESTSRVQQSAVVSVDAYLQNGEWEESHVRVKVFGLSDAMAGEGVVLRGEFKSLKPSMNPYDYDQIQSYYARSLDGIFYLAPSGLLLREVPSKLVPLFLNAREKWLRKIEDASDYGGYWMGFVLGEDDAIPEEAVGLIRRTGLAHVLAVSGMHVVLVYGFVSYVIGRLIKKRKTQDAVIIALLVFYLALNLMSFTVLRAVAFLIYHRFAFYSARRPDAVTAIGLIAAGDLLINSYNLFDLSFLLCIGSTLSIAFFYRSIHAALRFLGEALASSLGIIVAAQIGVLPIQLYVFNVFYPESLIFNLLFVPIFSFGICLSFVLSLLSFIPFTLPFLAVIFDVFMGLLENTLWQTGKWLTFPMSVTGIQVIGASIIALFSLWIFQVRGYKNKCLVSSVCICFMVALLGTGYHGFRVLVLSTGKSDAMLIQDKGQTFMIDTGAGKADLGLLLLKNDIRKLEGLIITHGDKDHIGGLSAIQEKIKVKQVIQGLSGPTEIKRGDLTLQLSYGDQTMNDNDASIVTLLTYKAFKMLFMGDAEENRERLLIDQGFVKAVDAVKIGHHGSDTSTGEAFVDETQAKLALICCDGSKYFPRQVVVERLQECGILVYRTDLSGCVELTLEADGIRIHEYLRAKNEL